MPNIISHDTLNFATPISSTFIILKILNLIKRNTLIRNVSEYNHLLN